MDCYSSIHHPKNKKRKENTPKTQKQTQLYTKASKNVSSLLFQRIPFSIEKTGTERERESKERMKNTEGK
jgi:hypothetical protein